MVPKTALVFGASGALGEVLARTLLEREWRVIGADVRPSSLVGAYRHVLLPAAASAEAHQSALLDATRGISLAAVLNVSGGWAAGGAADASSVSAAERMVRQSLLPAAAAAHLAAKRGAAGALLVLPGAAAALGPTPAMLAYGCAKAAVHHLTRSLAADPRGLPEGLCAVALLPETLDTADNRRNMRGADTNAWTPLPDAARLLAEWAEGTGRPPSGTLAVLRTRNGKTEVVRHS